jgi:O-antigen/teichoic acid export membrane protein
MALSLRKNFGFALIGNLCYALTQYLILVIYIKFFTSENVGSFIFASAFSTPLMMSLDAQLRNFYVTDQNNKYSFAAYFTFRFLTSIFGFVFISVISILLYPELFYFIGIVVLIKVFESQIDLIYGIYQKNNRLDYIAYSRIIRGSIALFSVFCVSYLFENILYSLSAYLFSWIFIFFLVEKKLVVKRGFIVKDEFKLLLSNILVLKPLFFLCLPMFFSIFLDKYYLNFPRLQVEKIFGLEMLGIFGSLMYFKSIGGQFITSLAQSAVPKLAEYYKNGLFKSFKLLLWKMISIGFSIGICLTLVSYLFGYSILSVLYTEEYSKYNDVLTFILIGATFTFSYTYIATALTSIRKQWVRLPISLFSFFILAVLFFSMKLKNLTDVTIIVLFVEALTFIVYYSVYFYFLRKETSKKEI